MSRAPVCSSSGESIVLIRHLQVWMELQFHPNLHARRLPTYTKYRINTIDSPDDEHRGARNM